MIRKAPIFLLALLLSQPAAAQRGGTDARDRVISASGLTVAFADGHACPARPARPESTMARQATRTCT